MRDEMKKGDLVLVYHSNTKEPAAVGIAEIVKEGYPDSHAFEKGNKYFDAKALKRGVNPWIMVDIKAKEDLKKPVTRPMMMEEKSLKDMQLLARGNRLSILPVTEKEFKTICRLGGLSD